MTLAELPITRQSCPDCGNERTYNWHCASCRLRVLLDTRCHRDRAHMAAQMPHAPAREQWFRIGGCACEPGVCKYKRGGKR